MRGIDISRYDGNPLYPDSKKAYEESDFVIVKATQGTSYKYTGYFEAMIQNVLADKKLAGAYHYAGGGDPVKEADYFLSIVEPYLGKIILALDWEEGQNKAWGSKNGWCKKFIDRVWETTGIICFLYTGMDGLDECRDLANRVPLWFAGYPQNKNTWTIPRWPSYYTTQPWKAYTIWQYTSGGDKVDRNVTNLSYAKWAEWCGNTPDSAPALYSGEFPKLPTRGYYALGDGYYQLPEAKEQVKNVQRLVNWINGGAIKIDGMYGPNTAAAVKLAQTNLKVYPDGLFGKKTLEASKKYRK